MRIKDRGKRNEFGYSAYSSIWSPLKAGDSSKQVKSIQKREDYLEKVI